MMSRNERVETAVDCIAATAFAAAIAFAASATAGALFAAILTAAAFGLAYAGLARIGGGRPHALPNFDVPAIALPGESSTDADEGAADGTVVRLFEPRQLVIARPQTGPVKELPDNGAQALSEALAKLKQSLR